MKITVGKGEKKTVIIDKSGEYLIEMTGEDSAVRILGIFIGLGQEKFQIKTVQHHRKGRSKSDLLVKSVLFDASRLEYAGLIKIDKMAQGSDAFQRNENLLMSPQAAVVSAPDLEIEADDVRCTHAATIGQLDNEQLFYLMSRGLAEKAAKKLLVEGFLLSLLAEIDDHKIKNRLLKKVTQKLEMI